MNWLFEKVALQPDIARALRAATAFSLTLLVCLLAGEPLAGQFAATAALSISLPQLRGAYFIRIAVLLVMVAVFTGSAFAGALAAGSMVAAIVGIGFLALLSGFWRHLSTDYGPSIGVNSALLFLIALEGPSHGATPAQIATWTALGGAGAALLNLGVWFFRPQHALRHAIADAWIAASDLFLAMRTSPNGEPSASAVTEQQRTLRETLDRATATLTGSRSRQAPALLTHLDQMRHEAAHLALQVTAFHTATEALMRAPEFAHHTSLFDSAMTELANMARSVAITVVTHRPENLELTAARLQTCQHLLQILEEQLGCAATNEKELTQAQILLRAVTNELPSVQAALTETVDHSLRLTVFPFYIPDLNRRSIRVLAAGLNPAPVLPPVLIRYSIRMAVLSMLAVAIYKSLSIPRGYWMAFALIVVLQPDYGATRQRAAQRVGGTFGGAIVGSALLMAHLPVWLLGILTSLTAFTFAYFLKRKYRVAIFFVTVMVVLVTEMHAPVHMDFTIGRLLSNLTGAGLALLAALYLWPRWEREQFPALLAKAIRANCDYFDAVMKQLATGGSFDRGVVLAKQKAERAGNIAGASLQRMKNDPAHQQKRTAEAAGAVSCNERVTLAIAVLATHLAAGTALNAPSTTQLADKVRALLEKAALAAEHGTQPEELPRECLLTVQRLVDETSAPGNPNVIAFSLEKLSTEVLALMAALRTFHSTTPATR